MVPIKFLVIELVFSIVIAWFVYRYYKSRKTNPSERYSTFGPRFWAPSVDAAVLWPITALLPYLFIQFFPKTSSYGEIFTSLFFFTYSIYFHGKYGGTIGKLKCKIIVVDAKTETKIGYLQALKRDAIPLVLIVIFSLLEIFEIENSKAFSAYISAIYLLWFLIEIITMLTNNKRRALHDFIADTVVIRPSTGTNREQT